jgi:hypothetical protein
MGEGWGEGELAANVGLETVFLAASDPQRQSPPGGTPAAEAGADWKRERADQIIERCQAATEALIKRLEELNGLNGNRVDRSD